jgi:CoA:oxalate CoA-transferase
MAGPLAGIRVLDLTQVLFGPFSTMILADMGAEVIKVERPKVGDIARGNGPVVRGVSTYFLSVNRGKKSIVLDLKTTTGTDLFLKLVEKADVLVENFTPGTMEQFGLSYDKVSERNPQIIYIAGSGFGQYGPYAKKSAFDIVIQAMGGIMSITGEEGGPPIRPGVSYGDVAAGLFLCIATLSALYERQVSGKGQFVDISMLDCQVTVQENAFVRYLNTGEIPHALGTRHPVTTPFQAFQTKNGYIAVASMGGTHDQWPLFCSIIDRVDIIDDPRFRNGWQRTQNYKLLEPILTTALREKTSAEWLEKLEEVGIPCGPVNNIAQVANDPQIIAREMIVNVHHDKAGTLKVVNTPFKFSRTQTSVQRASPELGEHTREVLTDLLHMKPGDIQKLADAGVIQ